MPIRSWIRQWLALWSLVLPVTTHAATIAFHLELTGTRLTLINTGDSTAFFPSALAMRADGTWQPASPPTGQPSPTQLRGGERMELVWPDARPLENLAPVERLRPTMVRFFDQTGVGFGHISLFMPPPAAPDLMDARYVSGALQLLPPKDTTVEATWVLLPHEEGVKSIRSKFNGNVVQPPAPRLDWRTERDARHIDASAAQPAAVLIHETAQGFRVQKIASGSAGHKQLRTQWLNSSATFYILAALLAAASMFVLARGLRRTAKAG